jgi:opacity protein-like surface antigen
MYHRKQVFLLSLLALNALASETEPQEISAVVSLRLGWDYAQIAQSQDVQLLRIDPAPDYFESSETNYSAFLFGGFLGLEFPLQSSRDMRWQTGVAYYQSTSFETEGVEYFLSMPDFGDIAYSYSINNQRFMIENKFLYGFTDRLYGYLLGGVGVALNKAYDYSAYSLNNLTPSQGHFDSNTMASFSYSVGLGLEAVVLNNWTMSLGYQFSDLGEYALGDYNFGDTTDTLTMPNMLTQELVFAVSVLF